MFTSYEHASAERRLKKLERCQAIRPYRVDDETQVCVNDGIEVGWDHGHFEHSAATIRYLRGIASETRWP